MVLKRKDFYQEDKFNTLQKEYENKLKNINKVENIINRLLIIYARSTYKLQK